MEEIVPIIQDTPTLRFKKDKLINTFKDLDFMSYLTNKLAEQDSNNQGVSQPKTQCNNQVSNSDGIVNNRKRKNQEPDLKQAKKFNNDAILSIKSEPKSPISVLQNVNNSRLTSQSIVNPIILDDSENRFWVTLAPILLIKLHNC